MTRKTVFLILSAILAFSTEQLAAGQSRGAAPRPNTPAPVAPQPVGPLSVGQVLESLYSLGVSRTEDLVARNKVRFEATPEILAILKEFGATARLLSFIPAPPPPPPPPEPRRAGPLTVTCEPVDCIVVANEKYYGTTRDRSMIVESVPPGDVTVQVFSNGFEAGIQKMALQEGQRGETRFQLDPTPETRQRKGQQYLLESVLALGGMDTMSLFLEFQGDGTLNWEDDKGQRQAGTLKFSKKPGVDLEMELKNKDGSCTALISGQTSKQTCRSGLKNSENVINQAATLFLKYEVRNLLGELMARSSTLSGSDSNRKIEASDRNASYALTFTNDQLPSELVYTLSGKPDSAVTVIYSDYGNLNGGRYPTTMEIRSAQKPPVLVYSVKGITTLSLKKP